MYPLRERSANVGTNHNREVAPRFTLISTSDPIGDYRKSLRGISTTHDIVRWNTLSESDRQLRFKHLDLSVTQRQIYRKLIQMLRDHVDARVGVDNFNGHSEMFVWNWWTWHRIILKISKATHSTRQFHEQDCWFSTFSARGHTARPKIHIRPGVMQTFQDESAKDPSTSVRFKFTAVPGSQLFKSSVARLVAVLVHGAPDSAAQQSSHRCHNNPQRCFNPNHVCWESDGENKSRNSCTYLCALFCLHTPKCIFTDVDGNYLPDLNIDFVDFLEPYDCDDTPAEEEPKVPPVQVPLPVIFHALSFTHPSRRAVTSPEELIWAGSETRGSRPRKSSTQFALTDR